MFVATLKLLQNCVSNFLNFILGRKMFFSSISSNSFNSSTVVDEEVEHFTKLSDIWWKGMPGLHAFNEMRVPLVVNGLKSINKLQAESIHEGNPLQGIRILDAGCGGGILTEALATHGADITGLDVSLELIKCARHHAELNLGPIPNLKYVHSKIEDFSTENHEQFDVVISSEVVEHIDSVDLFLEHCIKVLKPGGSIFLTTINRTIKSLFVSIVLREYILRNMPRGTHQWSRCVTPEELKQFLEKYNCDIQSVHGWSIDNFTYKWSSSEDISCSFGLHAIKRKQ